MNGLYLLGEDDEEMRKYRERFGQSPNSYHQGASIGGDMLAPPSRDLDPAALQSFLAQRAPEQREMPYPIPVRDDEPDYLSAGLHGLAGVADAFLNKGRGLGQIAQSHAAGEAARRQRSDDNFEADRKAYMDQGEAAARQQQIGLQGRNADMRQMEIDAQLAHQRAVQQRFIDSQPDPELERQAKEAEIRLSNARALQAEADAGRDPNAITPYQQAQLDAQKAEHKARGEDRDLDREFKKNSHATTTEANRLKAEELGAARQEKTDVANTTKFLDKTEHERAQAVALKGTEPIVNNPAYKKDLPGVGPIDSLAPSWLMHPIDSGARQDHDNLRRMAGQAQQYFKHEITGAAGSDREQTLLMHLKALEGGATEEQFSNALEFWKGDLQGKIRARATATPDVARRALEGQGLGDWALGPEAAAAQPQGIMEDARTSGPVTGTPRPSAATVEFDGDTYTAEEIELLRKAGYAP